MCIRDRFNSLERMNSKEEGPKEETTKKVTEEIIAHENVLRASDRDFPNRGLVAGYDFNKGLNYEALFKSYATVGFQAASLSRAIEIINQMISWRLSDQPVAENESEEYLDPVVRSNTRCTIFLGYTSNMVSSGLREIIRYLVQHKMVSAIVTTAGGIEEDFIKCLGTTYLGDFFVCDEEFRKKGLNRIGNLFVPNDNYCKFEDWLMPLLDEMLAEQKANGTIWSPSKMIKRLGERINNPESIYYWAAKNDIPVFCPALTDGSFGDMLFFHSYRKPGFIVDIVHDIRELNRMAINAKRSGVIILGGGIIKHHILNANMMRNGTEYAVYVNTGQEFDGSDAGARPSEAVSWGKIKIGAPSIKVCADATIVFPIIVAETFVRNFEKAARTSK
eukprot:TRINITY_DN8770_c0_g3_i1.p1 TRINITY_DN8770_c0_g3~~TRINITY_DN8770_c0_g3_i1.p1  ORF type:complete len:390 (-),score=87.91 TRINITY_DN8770_c0_g3_i1:273-1442(-)